MRTNVTEVIFILDRSGSMTGLESDTIGGYNSILKRQKEEAGEALLSTVLFDHEYELVHDRLAIREVSEIDGSIYYTRGTTALLDAVGRTINDLSKKQKEDQQKVDQTLCIITTDGYENASREYTKKHVKDLIELKKEQGWEFLFLGANIDSVGVAETFGIDEDHVANYHADQMGTEVIYHSLNETVSTMRKHKTISREWNKLINEDYKKRSL